MTNAAPEGYRPASMSGDNVVDLTCDTCAATVAVMAAERHTAWHEKLGEEMQARAYRAITEAFQMVEQRGRYNP
jgi:hypothetical protein